MRRSHVHLPLTTESGDLLPYATVTVLYEGTSNPVVEPLYVDNGDLSEPLGNPAIFAPGVFEIWCDTPLRVDLLIDGSDGYSATLSGVDVVPDPADIVRSTGLTHAMNKAEAERILTIHAQGKASWDYPTVIPAHEHDGAKPGSTVVNPGGASTDAQPDQTWVGYQSGSSAPDQTGGTSLGSSTDPAGRYATVAGAGAVVRTVVGVAPYASAVFGSDSYASNESVTLGTQSGRDADHSLSLTPDDDGQQRRYIDPRDVSLRNLRITDAASYLGSAQAVPATPAGVALPLWLRQDVVVPGALASSGAFTSGTASSLLSFFEHDLAALTSVPQDAKIPALTSLLSALAAYGLLTIA